MIRRDPSSPLPSSPPAPVPSASVPSASVPSASAPVPAASAPVPPVPAPVPPAPAPVPRVPALVPSVPVPAPPVPARPASGPTASASAPTASPPSFTASAPYDPLRLCVYATIAALAWLLGPVAVLGFALLGFAGYLRARRRGLTRSKCVLRDTRLVLAYLGALALAGAAAIAWQTYHLLT